jgi:GNAT superfamily N-acetyltransferase
MAISSQKRANQAGTREAIRHQIGQGQVTRHQDVRYRSKENQMQRNQTMQRRASSAITIRLFGTRDYEAVAAVNNAVFPDRPSTAEEWRYEDERFEKRYVNERYVAERPDTGEIVGFGGLWHVPWAFHPRKFGMEIRVRPDARRRGIGTALWRRIEEALHSRRAISVKTQVWEAMPDGLAFASHVGFREVLRAWESRLDVEGFDFPTFRPALDRALEQGVSITTLAAEREKDPENLRRLYAVVEAAIAEDIPRPPDDLHTPIPFDMWMEYAVEAPWSIPDAYFIAVVDGRYAGVSSLFRPQVGDWLNQGLTGVAREFRGRGLATALKVRTVEYARAHGVREIRTWNEINNQRILAINTKFGFVRQPAWFTLRKEFAE